MGGRAAVALTVIALLPIGPSAHLTAQTEGSILTVLPGSTRSAALGGAGAALVGDAGALFANPAGIATVRHLSIEGSYEPYLAGSAVSAAALALRVQRWTLGFGAQALDFGSEAEIVLMDDPMRGVDVGTKQEIYEMIRAEAGKDRTFLWYTTEMDELKHCDHVYVFRNGRIVADLARDELSEEKVLHSSFEEAS